jgi:EmrB/QacA subfamily drug resistance transporter
VTLSGKRLAQVASPLTSPARPDRSRLVFGVTALGAFMVSLDMSVVNVAFPALARSFPMASRASLAWVVTTYAIALGSLMVVGGRTADRAGRRRVFFRGLLIFLIGSLLCAVSPGVVALLAGRVVQGVGAALLLPASLGLLLASVASERRTRVVSMWAGVGALAVATGPTAGAALIAIGGWRLAFIVNLPLGAVAWLVGRRVLSETASTRTTAPDYLGVGLLSVGLGLLVLAISQGPAWGWTSAAVAGAVGGACVLLVGFVRRSSRHRAPVVDLAMFAQRSFALANAGTFFYAMALFSAVLGNILFLTAVWHYSVLRAGLAFSPSPVTVALLSNPAGRLAKRIGFRVPLLVGAACFASGLLFLATEVTPHSQYLTKFLPGMIVLGIGVSLTFPVLSAAAVSSLPAPLFAVGSAVNQTCRQIGGAIGVAALVALLGPSRPAALAIAGYHHLWVFDAVVVLVSGSLALAYRSSVRPADEPAADNWPMPVRRLATRSRK